MNKKHILSGETRTNEITHIRVYTADGTYIYLAIEPYECMTIQTIVADILEAPESGQFKAYSLFDGGIAYIRVKDILKVEFSDRSGGNVW